MSFLFIFKSFRDDFNLLGFLEVHVLLDILGRLELPIVLLGIFVDEVQDHLNNPEQKSQNIWTLD